MEEVARGPPYGLKASACPFVRWRSQSNRWQTAISPTKKEDVIQIGTAIQATAPEKKLNKVLSRFYGVAPSIPGATSLRPVD